MLIGVPKILSPELLKVLCEMGHSDRLVLGDGNFPEGMFARECGLKIVRADGHGIPELLEAILTVIPLDEYVETPVSLMAKMECDADLSIPVWDAYAKIVGAHDKRGDGAIGYLDRFEFYKQAQQSYCVVQTGEQSVYANVMIQKGVIK